MSLCLAQDQFARTLRQPSTLASSATDILAMELMGFTKQTTVCITAHVIKCTHALPCVVPLLLTLLIS